MASGMVGERKMSGVGKQEQGRIKDRLNSRYRARVGGQGYSFRGCFAHLEGAVMQ